MTDELYHHGVKGMKWGIRRYQNKNGSLTPSGKKRYNENGSEKTNKRLKKLQTLYKKYDGKNTNSQQRKTSKAYKQYDKSIAKDVKEALKSGDTKTAKTLAAGRAYMSITRSKYANIAVTDAALLSKVKAGEDFTYKFTRNNELGGVNVTINGKDTYFYSRYKDLN